MSNRVIPSQSLSYVLNRVLMIRMLMQEETLEILGLEQAVIYVSNMNRALDFYSRLLGIQVKVRSEEWSELVLNGIVVGLHQSKATPEERGNLTRAEGVKLG